MVNTKMKTSTAATRLPSKPATTHHASKFAGTSVVGACVVVGEKTKKRRRHREN